MVLWLQTVTQSSRDLIRDSTYPALTSHLLRGFVKVKIILKFRENSGLARQHPHTPYPFFLETCAKKTHTQKSELGLDPLPSFSRIFYFFNLTRPLRYLVQIFTIVTFIHYKPRIAAAIIDL